MSWCVLVFSPFSTRGMRRLDSPRVRTLYAYAGTWSGIVAKLLRPVTLKGRRDRYQVVMVSRFAWSRTTAHNIAAGEARARPRRGNKRESSSWPDLRAGRRAARDEGPYIKTHIRAPRTNVRSPVATHGSSDTLRRLAVQASTSLTRTCTSRPSSAGSQDQQQDKCLALRCLQGLTISSSQVRTDIAHAYLERV